MKSDYVMHLRVADVCIFQDFCDFSLGAQSSSIKREYSLDETVVIDTELFEFKTEPT